MEKTKIKVQVSENEKNRRRKSQEIMLGKLLVEGADYRTTKTSDGKFGQHLAVTEAQIDTARKEMIQEKTEIFLRETPEGKVISEHRANLVKMHSDLLSQYMRIAQDWGKKDINDRRSFHEVWGNYATDNKIELPTSDELHIIVDDPEIPYARISGSELFARKVEGYMRNLTDVASTMAMDDRLRFGSEVTVYRTDGRREDDWVLEDVLASGRATVAKYTDDQTLNKFIHVQNLAKMQPAPQLPTPVAA